jgi:hypothetical protein
MKPIKFKEVIALTAQRTGLSEEVIAGVVGMYFKEVRAALTSLSFPKVMLLNLGSFCLKPTKMEQRLMRRYALLERLSAEPERHQLMLQEVAAEIAQLEFSLEKIREEKARKILVKKMRQSGYEQGYESDRNMEEKGENI